VVRINMSLGIGHTGGGLPHEDIIRSDIFGEAKIGEHHVYAT
jgi:hypothetical protein